MEVFDGKSVIGVAQIVIETLVTNHRLVKRSVKILLSLNLMAKSPQNFFVRLPVYKFQIKMEFIYLL